MQGKNYRYKLFKKSTQVGITLLGVILSVLWLISIRKNLPTLDNLYVHIRWPDPIVAHDIAKSDKVLETIWIKSNIFVGQNRLDLSPYVVASGGKVFITGSLSQTTRSSLFALDASDGALLWQVSGHKSALYATISSLYAASPYKLTAYKPDTGNVLWSTRIPDIRYISHLNVADSLIYVEDSCLVQADSGELIEQSNSEFNPDYFERAVFNEEVMVRVYHTSREVEAIDRQSGKILWSIKGNVVSNVVATNTAVYVLVLEGELLSLHPRTGKVINSVQFKPSPFIFYNPETQPGGYYVAVDEDTGLLYAYLGDSAQLFAFKIVDYPETDLD